MPLLGHHYAETRGVAFHYPKARLQKVHPALPHENVGSAQAEREIALDGNYHWDQIGWWGIAEMKRAPYCFRYD